MNRHLNDAEFTQLLAGSMTPSVEQHLQVCGECHTEIANVRQSIGNFRLASNAWSQMQQAGGVHPRASRHTVRWFTLALAASLLVAVVPAGMYTESLIHQHQASMRAAEQAAEVQRDNHLLETVDRELAEEVAPSMQPLMLSKTTTTSTSVTEQQEQKKGDL